MNTKTIQVLLLEDEAAHVEAIKRTLESADNSLKVHIVSSLKEFREYVAINLPDIALLDMVLPDGNSIEMLKSPLELKTFPILVLTSHGNEQAAVDALHAGALDYIVKSPETFAEMPRILTRNLNHWALIQERNQAEEALKLSEQNFRSSMENSPLGIRIVSEDDKILYTNRAFLDIYGYKSLEEFKNTPDKKRYTPESYLEFLERREKRRRHEMLPDNYAVSIINKDSTVRHLQVIRKEILWGGKQQYQTIYQDITSRKQAEEVLRQNQQQQLQIRDQFLSRMSHELRSPLTPIHQFVTILLDGLTGDLNAEQREYLQIILRNVTQLRTMVSDLLDVARAESGKLSIDLRCIYLSELIPQVLKTFQLANTKDLLLSFDVTDNLSPVYADPDRVRQILGNLLDNAVKFTPEKGEISIRAQVSNRDPGFLSIAVTDTGCGISPEEQGMIFNYLYQVKSDDTESGRKGLGIGLYICKQLVSSHGGRIWVESQPGHGSTFFFTLPVFSLEGQLASIVKAADLITHSIALITVEVSHAEECPLKRETDQTALLDAWSALQSCTLPYVVVLLPRVQHTLSKELFFIIACVNQKSAEVLAEQLRNRLEQCQSLQDSRLNPKVSFILLDTRSKSKEIISQGSMNKEVVDHVEDLIKTALNKGRDLYEW